MVSTTVAGPTTALPLLLPLLSIITMSLCESSRSSKEIASEPHMVVLVTPDDGGIIPSMRLLGVEAQPPLAAAAFIAAAEMPKYGFGFDPEEFEFKKANESAREMVIAAVEDEGESCPNAARLNPA